MFSTSYLMFSIGFLMFSIYLNVLVVSFGFR